MDWQKAISESKKGTATRRQKNGNKIETFVRYKDGSGYRLVSENGIVIYRLSGEVQSNKLEGFTDWQPSK